MFPKEELNQLGHIVYQYFFHSRSDMDVSRVFPTILSSLSRPSTEANYTMFIHTKDKVHSLELQLSVNAVPGQGWVCEASESAAA